jgi:hypothetical protein
MIVAPAASSRASYHTDRFSKVLAELAHASSCVINSLDVKQARDFTGNGCRTDAGSISRFCAKLHRFRGVGAKSMPTRLLREHDLLCDFKEDRSAFPAAREKWFGS